MRRRWSEEEDDFLRFAFEKKMLLRDMEEALDGRTAIAIRSRITALGLRRNYPKREKDGLVRCSHCSEYKDKSEFIILSNGKCYCYCNECKAKLNKEKYLKNKKEKYLNQMSKRVKTKLEANENIETRKCPKCQSYKDVESFPWAIKGEKLASICSKCGAKIAKEYQEKRLRVKGF